MKELNYLLISLGNPHLVAQNANPQLAVQAMFPVGLAYISASMKQRGFHVYTLNSSFVEGDFKEAFFKILEEQEIDVVCTGGKSLDVDEVIDLFRLTKEFSSEIVTLLGGPIVSADPVTAMRVTSADIGVKGEGEETLCEVAQCMDSGQSLDSVQGILYCQDGEIIENMDRPEIEDIDTVPLMDFEGFEYGKWLSMKNYCGILHTARSCPFQCTFCYKSTGKRYRARSLDQIFAEIDYQIKEFGITSIDISDELFAAKKERVLDFCKRIKSYNLPWSCSLRIPEIEKELLSIMKDAGCIGVSTGIESGSDTILKSMNKRITVAQIESALQTMYDCGVQVLGNIIFGDTAETKETIEQSIAFWHKHNRFVYINVGMVCTYPGSPLYEYACEKGIIKSREEYLRANEYLINVSSLTTEEYEALISRVFELSFLPQIPAVALEIKEVDANGNCSLEWHCRKCNAKHSLEELHFLQTRLATCHCGAQNEIEPFKALHCDWEQLVSNLPSKELCFWGVGSQYYRINRFFDNQLLNLGLQVDGSPHQQKMTRLGKKINSPEIIKTRGIDTVIVTSPLAVNAILRCIKSDYPTVKVVFFPTLKKKENKYFPTFEKISL